MNIFVIPSWYPTAHNPIAGDFIREQTKIFAKYNKDDNLVLSRWGQGAFIADLCRPCSAFRKFIEYKRARCFSSKLLDNLEEVYTPALELRPRKWFWNIDSIVSANIENLKKSLNRYGKIDLLHAHVGFPAGYVASVLNQKFSIPYIITEHMGPFPFDFYMKKEKMIDQLERAYKGASKKVAVSTFLKNEMRKKNITNITVIPNIVDEDFFSINRDIVATEGSFLAVGRLSKEKGFDTLIKAFSLFCKENRYAVLNIAGNGHMKSDLKNLVSSLGLEKNVCFLGNLNRYQLLTQIHSSCALISSSYYETFGLSIAEALLCGKPVIATDSGGPSDMICDLNGVIVKKNDIFSMAKAIQQLNLNIKLYDAELIRGDYIKRLGREKSLKNLRENYKDVLRCVE